MTKRFSLKNKISVITGGVGILGKHFAKGLAESKSDLVIIDLDNEKCIEFAEKIEKKYNINCIGLGCDITNLNQVNETVKKIAQVFDPLITESPSLASKPGIGIPALFIASFPSNS